MYFKKLLILSIKNFKETLLCPLVSSLIMISILFLILIPFVAQSRLNISKALDDITLKSDQQIKMCGPNYWITWIIMSEKEKKFRFQDVRGYNKNADTIISSKALKLNTYYLTDHNIDSNSMNFLSNFENGVAGYYDDLSFFDNLSTAKEIIYQSNKEVKSIAIALTRNIFSNIVYVFIAATTSKDFNQCSRAQIVNNLEDLSIYAKGKL